MKRSYLGLVYIVLYIPSLLAEAAGVLPYYIDKKEKKAYVLIGKQSRVERDEGRVEVWGDFGGAGKKNEDPKEIAAREFSEETLGIYGTPSPHTYAQRIQQKGVQFPNYYVQKASVNKILPKLKIAPNVRHRHRYKDRYSYYTIYFVDTGKFARGSELYKAREVYAKKPGSKHDYKEVYDFYWMPLDDLIAILDTYKNKQWPRYVYFNKGNSSEKFFRFFRGILQDSHVQDILRDIQKKARGTTAEPKQPTIFPKENDTALKNALEDLNTSLAQVQSLLEAN